MSLLFPCQKKKKKRSKLTLFKSLFYIIRNFKFYIRFISLWYILLNRQRNIKPTIKWKQEIYNISRICEQYLNKFDNTFLESIIYSESKSCCWSCINHFFVQHAFYARCNVQTTFERKVLSLYQIKWVVIDSLLCLLNIIATILYKMYKWT